MNRFPHLAQRLFNVPIDIHLQKVEVIVAAVADRLGIAHVFRADALSSQAGAFGDDDARFGLPGKARTTRSSAMSPSSRSTAPCFAPCKP